MPAEHRIIRFGPKELFKALEMKLLEDDMPRLSGKELSSISIDKDQNDSPVVIKTDDETREFERSFFVMALIFYCGGHNIPLPLKGLKNMQILEKEVALEIKMGEAA